MGEAVGHGIALRLFLQAVVAHRGGGADGFLQVAGFKQVFLLGVARPDAGEAVGLQFGQDRDAVGLRLVRGRDLRRSHHRFGDGDAGTGGNRRHM